ncbi:hypothetical protein BD779DRAFT_1561047 [Infundibulicybe gibba]|nr:hypothetical protein BD779DRAFT_1561047 [Infundibulicybe gibba]
MDPRLGMREAGVKLSSSACALPARRRLCHRVCAFPASSPPPSLQPPRHGCSPEMSLQPSKHYAYSYLHRTPHACPQSPPQASETRPGPSSRASRIPHSPSRTTSALRKS